MSSWRTLLIYIRNGKSASKVLYIYPFAVDVSSGLSLMTNKFDKGRQKCSTGRLYFKLANIH